MYEILASEQLPSIDSSRSIKRVLLHGVWLKRCNVFLRVGRRVSLVSFAAGMVLVCSAPFVDRRTSGHFSIVASVLLPIPTLTSLLNLRFDMVLLLVQTFDYWYFTSISFVSNALVCANLGDVRVLVIIIQTVLYQIVFFADANARGKSSLIYSSLVGAAALLTFLMIQSLHLVRDYGDLTIATYSNWTLTASDVVTNGYFNIALLLLRNAYRKSQAKRMSRGQLLSVQCVTLRCRLKLKERINIGHHQPSVELPESGSSSNATTTASISQLRLVPHRHTINGGAFVQPCLCLPPSTPNANGAIWTGVGFVGIMASVASTWGDDTLRFWLACIGVTSSILYTLRSFMFLNRQMLRLVLNSFDFVFLTTQTYVAHFVLCYLFQWNLPQCIIILSSFVWLKWVFTLDLLTPNVRKCLSLTPKPLAQAVLVLHIVGVILLCVNILYTSNLGIHNGVLIQTTLGGRSIEIKALPFLFSRMLTFFWWCWRLLWRLSRCSETELLLVRGAIEFDDHDNQKRLRGAKKLRGSPRVHSILMKHKIRPEKEKL